MPWASEGVMGRFHDKMKEVSSVNKSFVSGLVDLLVFLPL